MYENPDKFADLEKLHAAESVDTVREHCVRKIDDLRAEIRAAVSAGDRAAETAANTEKLRIDTWLLSRLEPQEIVGSSGRRPRPELSAFLPLGLRREV